MDINLLLNEFWLATRTHRDNCCLCMCMHMGAFVHINKHEHAPVEEQIGLKWHEIKWLYV